MLLIQLINLSDNKQFLQAFFLVYTYCKPLCLNVLMKTMTSGATCRSYFEVFELQKGGEAAV